CKGFVIAQVERIAASGSLNPRHVKIPSVLIDCVVVAQPENHVQTYATGYNGAFSGELRAPADRNVPMALDNRKIIARRCALELPMGGVVNLGIGMPEGVASVAAEEKLFDFVTLTAEPGIIGGIPQGGLDFGASINAESIIAEGKSTKFIDKVDQITFSGKLAATNRQPVLYVTERCVFRLTPEGLELIEIAPGVDMKRDILALMGFRPIIRAPKSMDVSLF